MRDEGLVKPLREPISGAGATIAMFCSSIGEEDEVSTAAAESSTEGTAWSSCSVNFPLGVRCGFAWVCDGDGEIGSMSRSKMADDDE